MANKLVRHLLIKYIFFRGGSAYIKNFDWIQIKIVFFAV